MVSRSDCLDWTVQAFDCLRVDNFPRRSIIKRTVPAVVSLALAGSAFAQTIPNVISPLRVEPDVNGVNIASGKIAIPSPSISIPAAPNLKFDGAQNAAPYMLDDTTGGGDSAARTGISIHTGAGSSESFTCFDFSNCLSKTGSGSTFEAIANIYTQAGTGAIYTFDLQHFKVTANQKTQSQYYASRINYPNGEVISYSYDTYVQNSRPYYRPTLISSSMGYAISITYQSSNFFDFGWARPAQATLYAAGAPGTPLARLTYSAPVNGEVSITDLGGRVFKCGGCAWALGAKIESEAGTSTLPSEGTPAVQVGVTGQVGYAGSAGSLVGSVSRDGVNWTYTYTNPRLNGQMSNWIYDALTVTGPNGYNQRYALTGRAVGGAGTTTNVISSITDSLNRTTSFVFDSAFRPITMTMPEGNSVALSYDDYGNIVSKVSRAKPGSGLADITETAYVNTLNCLGVLCYRPVWIRDGLGRQTDFIYNGAGQLIEQTDPADVSGVRRKTYITYDSSSGISRQSVVRICGTGAACGTNAEIRTEYLYWGNTLLPSRERRIDSVNGVIADTVYDYDTAGRLVSVDGPLPGTADAVYYRYDIVGRRIWEIGAVNATGARVVKRTTYRDADDKVIAVETGWLTDPNAATFNVTSRVDMAYDSRRNLVREAVSSAGTNYRVSDRTFDDRGRPVCETVRMNLGALPAAGSSACALGTAGAFGPDRITQKSYDAASQLLKVTLAVGTPDQADDVTYTYRLNGKQATVADALGNLTTYEYDGFDRLAKTRFPIATNGGVSSTTDYEGLTYDAVGNITVRRLRDGNAIGYIYDNLNRMTFKDVPSLNWAEFDITYQYDLMGRLTRATDSNTHFTARTYDPLGRMTSEQSNWTTRNYQYDIAGRRTRLTWGDGFYVDYARDGTGAITSISEAGGVLGSYGYDNLGRMTSLSRGNGVVSSYGYDPASRLTSLSHTGTNVPYSTTFSYTAASQIASSTRDNDAYAWIGHYNVDRPYSVNGLNQLTGAGSTALAYDGRGNLTQSGSSTYSYTSENRLAAANGTYTMTWDPLGRFHWLGANTYIPWMQYDGDQIIEERGDTGVLRRYVFGPGDDAPLVWYEGAGTADRRWLLPDERGSIIAVTNSNGTAIAINRYDEYGIPAATNVGRFQYTGQAWLPELGLYHYKARIYSPTLGRFMQTDPIGYKDGVNWYAYVGNDPVNAADTSGLSAEEKPGLQTGSLTRTTDKPNANAVQSDGGRFGGGGTFRAETSGGKGVASGSTSSAAQPASSGSAIQTVLRKLFAPLRTADFLASVLNQAASDEKVTGTFVYRVYGGEAGMRGKWWTPFDPRQYKNEAAMRNALALLPEWNSANRVAYGYVRSENVAYRGIAQPQVGSNGVVYPGGGPELRVKNPWGVNILSTSPLSYGQ